MIQSTNPKTGVSRGSAAPAQATSSHPPVLVTDEGAAKLLSMSVQLWRKMVREGAAPPALQAFKARAKRPEHGLARWRVDELRAWANAGCPPAAEWSWSPTGSGEAA